MPATVAQSAQFSFTPSGGGGIGKPSPPAAFRGRVSKIEIETPTAEIVDVTGLYDASGAAIMVPTGAYRGGSIRVDYIANTGANQGVGDADSLVGWRGQLSFTATGYSVTKNCILESTTSTAAAGDIVRGSMRFILTDWYG